MDLILFFLRRDVSICNLAILTFITETNLSTRKPTFTSMGSKDYYKSALLLGPLYQRKSAKEANNKRTQVVIIYLRSSK